MSLFGIYVFRLGDEKKITADAFGANKANKNIIIDHCSMSWATDECASFYRNSDFTLQWCIISESLNASVHEKGNHGYGGIWGGRGASFHHNLIANHKSRMPRFSGSKTTPNSTDELVDFRNNVLYNWESNNIYGGEKGRYNIVNNYYKPGPATIPSKKNRILEVYSPYGSFYVDGNFVKGNEIISKNNWKGVQGDSPASAFTKVPFTVEPILEQKAEVAYIAVLTLSGSSIKRDAVDSRIVKEVRTGISSLGPLKNGIIDSQKDVGGWPTLTSLPANADTDQDGMPDSWEKSHNLNPNNDKDSSLFTIDKLYTNIEIYLNGLIPDY